MCDGKEREARDGEAVWLAETVAYFVHLWRECSPLSLLQNWSYPSILALCVELMLAAYLLWPRAAPETPAMEEAAAATDPSPSQPAPTTINPDHATAGLRQPSPDEDRYSQAGPPEDRNPQQDDGIWEGHGIQGDRDTDAAGLRPLRSSGRLSDSGFVSASRPLKSTSVRLSGSDWVSGSRTSEFPPLQLSGSDRVSSSRSLEFPSLRLSGSDRVSCWQSQESTSRRLSGPCGVSSPRPPESGVRPWVVVVFDVLSVLSGGIICQRDLPEMKGPLVVVLVHVLGFLQVVLRPFFAGARERAARRDGTREHGTRDDGTPEQGTLDDGALERTTRCCGTPECATVIDDGTREQGTRDDGTREHGTRDDGTREQGTRDDGTREHGTRDDGTLEQGTLDDGALESAARYDGTPERATLTDDGTREYGTRAYGTGEQAARDAEARERAARNNRTREHATGDDGARERSTLEEGARELAEDVEGSRKERAARTNDSARDPVVSARQREGRVKPNNRCVSRGAALPGRQENHNHNHVASAINDDDVDDEEEPRIPSSSHSDEEKPAAVPDLSDTRCHDDHARHRQQQQCQVVGNAAGEGLLQSPAEVLVVHGNPNEMGLETAEFEIDVNEVVAGLQEL